MHCAYQTCLSHVAIQGRSALRTCVCSVTLSAQRPNLRPQLPSNRPQAFAGFVGVPGRGQDVATVVTILVMCTYVCVRERAYCCAPGDGQWGP